MKQVKRIAVLVMTVALACSCTLPAFAAQTVRVTKPQEVSVVMPGGYTVITEQSLPEQGELVAFLGQTPKQVQKWFTQEGFLAFGVSQDYRRQITVVRSQDEVSKGIRDLSALEGEALSYARNLLTNGISSAEGYLVSVTDQQLGGRRFCKITGLPEQKGDAFLQYLTVIDSACYAVCLFDQSGQLNEEDIIALEACASSLSVIEQDDQELRLTVQSVIGWVFLAIAAAILGFSLLRIRAIRRARRVQEDYLQKTPKKPRR